MQWADGNDFIFVATRAMRRILVDYVREHKAERRGGVRRPLPLDVVGDRGERTDIEGRRAAIQLAAAQRADELGVLDEALERVEKLDEPRDTVSSG